MSPEKGLRSGHIEGSKNLTFSIELINKSDRTFKEKGMN